MPNENTPTAWARFIAAQADMANPVKTKEVRAGARRYSYEVLPDVLDIVKTALNAHGLALIQAVGPSDKGWTLRTGVADENGPLWMDERPLDFPADDQVAASKQTYAKRQAIKTVFGIAGVDEDDDGQAAHEAATMPVRGSESRSKAPSSPATGASATLSEKERFVALLGQCRQQGLDSVAIGKQVGATIGKASKDFTEADYTQACRLVIDIAAKTKETGHER